MLPAFKKRTFEQSRFCVKPEFDLNIERHFKVVLKVCKIKEQKFDCLLWLFKFGASIYVEIF